MFSRLALISWSLVILLPQPFCVVGLQVQYSTRRGLWTSNLLSLRKYISLKMLFVGLCSGSLRKLLKVSDKTKQLRPVVSHF